MSIICLGDCAYAIALEIQKLNVASSNNCPCVISICRIPTRSIVPASSSLRANRSPAENDFDRIRALLRNHLEKLSNFMGSCAALIIYDSSTINGLCSATLTSLRLHFPSIQLYCTYIPISNALSDGLQAINEVLTHSIALSFGVFFSIRCIEEVLHFIESRVITEVKLSQVYATIASDLLLLYHFAVSGSLTMNGVVIPLSRGNICGDIRTSMWRRSLLPRRKRQPVAVEGADEGSLLRDASINLHGAHLHHSRTDTDWSIPTGVEVRATVFAWTTAPSGGVCFREGVCGSEEVRVALEWATPGTRYSVPRVPPLRPAPLASGPPVAAVGMLLESPHVRAQLRRCCVRLLGGLQSGAYLHRCIAAGVSEDDILDAVAVIRTHVDV